MEDKKLTICFLGEAKPDDIHTVKWAKYFSDKGHNIYLFSYSDFGNNRVKEIKLYLLKKKFPITLWPLNTVLNMPFTIKKVRKLLKEIKPDIVHAHCVTSYGTLASMIGFKPFVLTAWGSDILINPYQNFLTNWATKYVLKKADLITCDANHMKEAMTKLGADESKIKIVYFGVDTEKFKPGEKDEDIVRKLNLENSLSVISLRGLGSIYNIETLVRSVPLIIKVFPSVKFIIAGKGSEMGKLKKIVEELKIIQNVGFIGWISPEELVKYLRTVDIYVSTSLSDGGLSSATAEAMACELPVVITDSGENKEWIDGKNGFIIPVKNPEALAQKIIYLLENKDKRLMFGKEARKTIKQRNDYYNEMEKMENIYYQLALEKH